MIDAVIDLSHHQASVDMAKVGDAGILAVMLKATQGTRFIDPRFVERVRACDQAGMLVGAYHFLDASSPKGQVAHFLSVTGGMSVLAIDIEPNSVSGGTVGYAQAAEVAAGIQMLTGRYPLAYTGRYGPDGKGSGYPNSVLARCPLWIAAYNNRLDPKLPVGWDDWLFWQYTESGSVPGVKGPCDRNRFNGSADQLEEWWRYENRDCFS